MRPAAELSACSAVNKKFREASVSLDLLVLWHQGKRTGIQIEVNVFVLPKQTSPGFKKTPFKCKKSNAETLRDFKINKNPVLNTLRFRFAHRIKQDKKQRVEEQQE